MARASVSFRMKKLKVNGSGDEYQSWNSDQLRGMRNNRALEAACLGNREPVSASAMKASAAFDPDAGDVSD